MKKIVKSFILVAAAAMGFSACQKEIQEEVPVNEGTVQVTFVSGSPETKTTVDTSSEEGPVFSWDENETFAVLEQTDALAAATSVTYEKVDGKANITATFDANAGKESYNYVTVYPASGYVSAESLAAATLSLPAVQTMAESSYDPNADLMVSEVVSANAQPTEAQMVSFTRMAAVVKMSIKNLTLAEGDEVEQVVFTADGKTLAGTITANLAAPNGFAAAEGSSSVTVNTSSTDVYFTVLPTTLEAGNSYTVTVLTNKKIYIKNGAIPAEKSLVFEKGMVTRFGVDMAEVTPIDKWVLVRDASTLKEGDVVAIVAKDYDKALSTKLYSNASETSTSAKRDAEDISKFMDYIIANTYVQQLVLVTGTVDGTFSFYDEARQKFLVSSTTSNAYLINQAYCNENTSFKVTIDENTIATITNISGTYSGNYLRYNTSDYFVSNTSKYAKDVCIYLLAGVTRSIPTVPANITVPEEDESVVISEDEATEPTAISTELVKFNYVGPWTITPSVTYEEGTDTGWLNVTYDAENNCLTYTAEANAGAKRNATVTLTATLGNQTLEPWTFNVLQKGLPEEISIEGFRSLTKDLNTTYKLTGKVVVIGTRTSAWTIEDTSGNQVKIAHLYTEEGKYASDESIGVQIGDIITFTAVVTGSTGKSTCGSDLYRSIYKGHYGLSISASPAAKYDGGTVTISVATNHNGKIDLPEPVTGEMEPSDYAEFSYTPGTSTATVTFATANTTTDNRKATVTFTYGLISTTVVAEQEVNPANKVKWNLVTDASTLTVGDELVIVSQSSNKVLGCLASSAIAASVNNFPAVDIEKSTGVVYDAEKAGALVFTLAEGNSDDTFAFQFKHNDGSYYLYVSSSSSSSTLRGNVSISDYTSFSLSVSNETGEAEILNNVYSKIVKFNSATGTTFLAYGTSKSGASKIENAVAIYKKQK